MSYLPKPEYIQEGQRRRKEIKKRLDIGILDFTTGVELEQELNQIDSELKQWRQSTGRR